MLYRKGFPKWKSNEKRKLLPWFGVRELKYLLLLFYGISTSIQIFFPCVFHRNFVNWGKNVIRFQHQRTKSNETCEYQSVTDVGMCSGTWHSLTDLWSEIKYSAFVCLGLIWVNVRRAYCFCLCLCRLHVNIITTCCQRSTLAKLCERAMKLLACRCRAINILAGILCLLASWANRQQVCAPETITDSQTHCKKCIYSLESQNWEQCRKVSSACFGSWLVLNFLFRHFCEA